MGILFIISVTALLALLWATFATARHIRRARKRQRNVRHDRAGMNRSMEPPEQAGSSVSSVGDANAAVLKPSPATREWSQMRYTASSFTAERALHRKI